MFSRIILKFHIINLNRKFNELSDSIVKTAYTLFLFSANQNEAPKIFKKNILFIIAAKKYDPVPQFLCSIAKTSKCFNRVHPNSDDQNENETSQKLYCKLQNI